MAEPLKYVYNKAFFNDLTQHFKSHHPTFDGQLFTKLIFDKTWDTRELKDRMRHITHCIHQTLDLPYKKAIPILKKVAPNIGGFEGMFFPDFVEVYGLNDWKTSKSALARFTQYSSSEFAIRPFILQDEKTAMQQMLDWSTHTNHHIRRLSSEGCRPRLPWAMALPKYKKDPKPILPILENLKADDSEYVRKSVANNLNDISKDHPDLVLKIAKTWQGNNPQTNWIIKHACRTLLKQGNPKAMRLFGFGNPIQIEIDNLKVNAKKIKIGNDLHFDFDLVNQAKKSSLIRVEYAIDYVKKTGKTSRKVFKITENTYSSGANPIHKKQAFKDFSTRTHYAGTHRLGIIVNGVEKAFINFEVTN